MKKRIVIAGAIVVALAGLSGCAEIVSSVYRAAVTDKDASVCIGLKGKSVEEAQGQLGLKAASIKTTQDGKQEIFYNKGNFAASLIFGTDGKVESTICGDLKDVQKDRFAKQFKASPVFVGNGQ